ncbi:MAG: type II toxin-antitoxin system YafQ family toxin [Parachlamydiaceae bacterium]|nr:type II toxin-antitoxin system YafQ family toxin [Parachlamydiaceae bacterium]
MRTLKVTKQFKKDLKRFKNKENHLKLLDSVLLALLHEKPLDPSYLDHPLMGNWRGCRECHIMPDFLLIYRVFDEEKILKAERIGSHSELLKM